MNKSEQINELVAALAKAQAGLTSIARNRKVRVKSKRTDTTYEFEYTTFDAIIEHARQALTTNGLWFTQTLESGDSGKYRLVTTLMHQSGQWLSSETPLLVEDGGNQAFGSALTYMKRYALAALLGIASDDDDDANEADGNSVQSRQDRQPRQPVRQVEPPPSTMAGRKIEAQGQRTASQYKADCIAALAKIKTSAELTAWSDAERDTLEKLEKVSRDTHTAIMDKVAETMDRVSPKRAAAE